MATHIDRKTLREDAFQNTMFWALDWVYQRRRFFISIGVAVVLVVAAGAGYYLHRRSELKAQSERFYQIERGAADSDQTPEQRRQQARREFAAFAQDYPGSRLGAVAWMHVARIAWEQGDLEAARQAFRAVLDQGGGTETQQDLAHIGLGKLDEQQGHLDAAEAQYRAVSDGNFEALKALSLGRIALARQQDEEARRHFEKAARSTNGAGGALAEWARQNLDYHP